MSTSTWRSTSTASTRLATLRTRFSDARDPLLIKPGVALVIADGEALTLGLIVDLLKVVHKTFVHVEVLPRTVDDYTDRYSHASHRQRACA